MKTQEEEKIDVFMLFGYLIVVTVLVLFVFHKDRVKETETEVDAVD